MLKIKTILKWITALCCTAMSWVIIWVSFYELLDKRFFSWENGNGFGLGVAFMVFGWIPPVFILLVLGTATAYHPTHNRLSGMKTVSVLALYVAFTIVVSLLSAGIPALWLDIELWNGSLVLHPAAF